MIALKERPWLNHFGRVRPAFCRKHGALRRIKENLDFEYVDH